MKAHTALPWFEHENTGVIIGANGGTQVCDVGFAFWDNLAAASAQSNNADFAKDHKAQCKANAAFIVRACNSHEALLAACEAARNELSGTPRPEAILGLLPQLQAAIAAAKEGDA